MILTGEVSDDDDDTPRYVRRPGSMSGIDRDSADRKRRRADAPVFGIRIRDQVDDLAGIVEALPLKPPPDYPEEDSHPIDVDGLPEPLVELHHRVDRANRRIKRAKRDSNNTVLAALASMPMLKRIWRGLCVLIGILSYGVGKLIVFVHMYDAVEARTQETAARVQLIEQVLFLRSQPAATPEKVNLP